ncbi:MAG: hypothetical protein EWM47_04860 [Anaerolineaceae bacterium]|nr:MAG: hypothetical protein EWM47_04860 [Anaerolineaceae bacterium]
MKKMIALVMGLLLIFSLAACTPKSNDDGKTPTPTTKPEDKGEDKNEEDTANKENIRIGVITSITGERALVGEYAKYAIDMAVEDVNAAGGVLGRQVEVVYEDDLGTDVGAVNALNKLATDDKISAIVGPYYGTMILALDGEIRKAEIPVLSATSLTTVGDFGNPWLFQARTHDGHVPGALVEYVVGALGDKVSIIYGTDASGVGQMEAAVAKLEELGLEAVSIDAYNSGDKDFTAQILHVQAANPDVIVAFGLQVEAGLIMKQLRDMGVETPIAGLASYASKIAIDLAKEASNGVLSLTDFIPDTPREEGRVFADKYKTKYNLDSDFTAAVEYDKFQLIVEAIKIAGSTEREAIRDAMFEIQGYKGVANVYAFNEKGVGGTSILLIEIQDGVAQPKEILDIVKFD